MKKNLSKENCHRHNFYQLQQVDIFVFHYTFHIKPQVFKKLYRGHFLVNFPEIWSHKRKPGMILVRKQSNWNQWKIVETIYTPSQNGHFWPVLTVSSNFQKTIFRGKLAKKLEKNHPRETVMKFFFIILKQFKFKPI